jgi:carboxymethylenebutenolidase
MPRAGAVAHPEKLRCTDITYPGSDGAAIEAYVARPEHRGTYPGMIVIHEAFGPVEHIRDVARRFAQLGYVAIAPNLYSREGAPGAEDMGVLLEKMFGQDDRQAVLDLEGAASWLRADNESNTRVGVIGFCSGGRMALLFASTSASPDAAVYCWGGFIDRATPAHERTSTRPQRVIDAVARLTCPLLVVHGALDDNPSPADIEKLTSAVEAAGGDYKVLTFESAGHAFFADYRDSYHEASAHELWPQVTEFFSQRLK